MEPNIFHQHLDVCAQCREHPFDLCHDGRTLLVQAVQLHQHVTELQRKTLDDWAKGGVVIEPTTPAEVEAFFQDIGRP